MDQPGRRQVVDDAANLGLGVGGVDVVLVDQCQGHRRDGLTAGAEIETRPSGEQIADQIRGRDVVIGRARKADRRIREQRPLKLHDHAKIAQGPGGPAEAVAAREDPEVLAIDAGEANGGYKVLLWRTGPGSQLALYPNLNVEDPVWRGLVRDVRFRRALSLATNRHEINQAIYFGLAIEGQNTVLPQSPLYRPQYRTAAARQLFP